MNKYVEVNQCTILCHIYDIKVSHYNPNVVTTIINMIKSSYVRESILTFTCGKFHEYLGITIDFSKKR